MSDMHELFGDTIFVYTCEDAVRDGVLVHPFPDRFPWLLLSTKVHAACTSAAEKRVVTYEQVAMPLMLDVAMAAKASLLENRFGRRLHEGDFIDLEGTVAGVVWISGNEKGGLTVYCPEER